MPASHVKIRMYRQGLGDCFLLTFDDKNGNPFYMLIDCGVLLGTKDAETRMTEIAEDIGKTTGNHVHVVVATHEHWDHLSGFIQAELVFSKLQIDSVWLAWTEDPGNRLARKLRSERKRRERALRAAATRMQVAGMRSASAVQQVLDFFGDSMGARGASTEAALDALSRYCNSEPRYCHPEGDPIVLPQLPGVRFYVLGPPEDEKQIKRSNPSKRASEVYEISATPLNAANAFLAAAVDSSLPLTDLPEDDLFVRDASCPFDAKNKARITVEDAKNNDFFRKHYFDDQDQSWRRIDDDWLETTGQLALQLDSDTNNTSLVLAIELVESGRVLLFPGDAQVGSWLSWTGNTWKIADEQGRVQYVTSQELLKKTVLYKVGHHGSHNATLREAGLEQMVSPDLVALIPVDKEMAKKKRWNMPFRSLLHRLMEKTKGRILQIDDVVQVNKRPVPEGCSKTAWTAFQKGVEETELYFEISLKR